MGIVKIVFEGLDGSGKGTTIRQLHRLISSKTYSTPDSLKNYRREKISEFGDGQELHAIMVESYVTEWKEIDLISKQLEKTRSS